MGTLVLEPVRPGAGVYAWPRFLDAGELDRIRRAMERGEPEPAEILAGTVSRDGRARRATHFEVDAATLALVEHRLDRHREVVARAFGLTLTDREGPGFLRYPHGGRYGPHRDRADVPSWPDAARRLVAVVVFLNSCRQVDPSGEFDAGVLRLLPEGETPSVDLLPHAGTLVAFGADRLHEVTEVLGGTRETIVDWYYG